MKDHIYGATQIAYRANGGGGWCDTTPHFRCDHDFSSLFVNVHTPHVHQNIWLTYQPENNPQKHHETIKTDHSKVEMVGTMYVWIKINPTL